MAKAVFIAEKPSVAQEFAKALKEPMRRGDGYLESDSYVVTWCVGHLVTMSYPEAYDPKYKKWSLSALPFLPDHFLYEVIPSVKKQFRIVSGLLNRADVDTIYVCTDSGREGEYIYRLVEQEAHVKGKTRRRVWIDSQTEEEIHRGIAQAKDLSEYDNLASAAYLRAKEDYLMGINFSRLLTLKYGGAIADYLGTRYSVISVGRVMTCVLGMAVRREREIRRFVKTPFYRVMQGIVLNGRQLEGEFRAVEGSAWYLSPKLYKENGFREKEDAQALAAGLLPQSAQAGWEAPQGSAVQPQHLEKRLRTEVQSPENQLRAETQLPESQLRAKPQLSENNSRSGSPDSPEAKPAPGENVPAEDPAALILPARFGETTRVCSVEKKKEKKNPPLLYNLAELQNECSRMFKISPDETLRIVQELYEKKLVTYPRTDARVLSTAVAREIDRNLSGLRRFEPAKVFAEEILAGGTYKGLAKTRYVNDKQITDHYAIIPTGQGLQALPSLKGHSCGVYAAVVRRFLSIFYPAAEYQKISMTTEMGKEKFFYSFRVLLSEGYYRVAGNPDEKKKGNGRAAAEEKESSGEAEFGADLLDALKGLRRGMALPVTALRIREGETSPPKRYNSGSMILAMENAGQLIEDEELRAQIKSCGIGTSATRAEILKKLVTNGYLALNKKTQILTPTLLGEMIHDVVYASIRSLLNPELTASWEKGLNYVAEGSITGDEYMEKLEKFIRTRTDGVQRLGNDRALRPLFDQAAQYYPQGRERKPAGRR